MTGQFQQVGLIPVIVVCCDRHAWLGPSTADLTLRRVLVRTVQTIDPLDTHQTKPNSSSRRAKKISHISYNCKKQIRHTQNPNRKVKYVQRVCRLNATILKIYAMSTALRKHK